MLALLVNRPGALISREEIKAALWQGDTFVDFEQGLNYCIRQIRIALQDKAEGPSFVETIPRRGYRFIAAVHSAPEPVAALTETINPAPEIQPEAPEPVVDTPSAPLPASSKPFPWMFVTAGLLGLLALLGLIYYRGWRHNQIRASVESQASSPTPTPRPSIAVLGLENLHAAKEDAWLSTALSEMLSTELAQGEKLRLISGEDVSRARPTTPLPESLSHETLTALRQQLGADLVVMGSYAVLPEGTTKKIRVDLRLQDARDGRTLAAFSQTGNEASLFNLVSDAGTRLREELGVGQLSPSQVAWVDHSLPSDTDARRLYAEALDRLRRFDALGAREQMEEVIKLEPKFAPAHSVLAAAWSDLGYELNATVEAKKAMELSAGLPREEQLSIEARYYEMSKDRAKASETLHALVSFFPDSLDYGIRLEIVQFQADQNTEALASLERLRKLPSPIGDSPKLDLAEAQFLSHQGDFKKALNSAEQALQKSRNNHSRYLIVQALTTKASVLERLGSLDASLQASSEAKQVATDIGFYRGVGLAEMISGDALTAKGAYEPAREIFQSALAVFREIGDKRNQGQSLERIGNTFHDQGKFGESQIAYGRARDIYREIQWPTGISSAVGNLANTLDAQGDLNGSLQMHLEALAAFQQIGNKRAIASEINNIAFVQQELGSLPAAEEGHRKSIALHSQTGYQRGQMYAIGGLGDVFYLQGKLEAARQQYQSARDLGEKTKEDDNVALYDLQLADVDYVERHLLEAETRLRRAITQFQKSKDPEANSQAYALLTEILVEQKRLPEAAESAKLAESNSSQISSLPPQFEVELARASLESANGKKDAARKHLLAVSERSCHSGYQQYCLESKWRLIALDSGKLRERQLTSLLEEARRKGFGLISIEIANNRQQNAI